MNEWQKYVLGFRPILNELGKQSSVDNGAVNEPNSFAYRDEAGTTHIVALTNFHTYTASCE